MKVDGLMALVLKGPSLEIGFLVRRILATKDGISQTIVQ